MYRLPPSFPTRLPVKQTHETVDQSTVSWVCFRRVGKRGGSRYIVCTVDNCKMFFNLLLARKNTFFHPMFGPVFSGFCQSNAIKQRNLRVVWKGKKNCGRAIKKTWEHTVFQLNWRIRKQCKSYDFYHLLDFCSFALRTCHRENEKRSRAIVGWTMVKATERSREFSTMEKTFVMRQSKQQRQSQVSGKNFGEEAKCLWTPYTHLFFRGLISYCWYNPQPMAKWSLNRRDNNSSNDTRRCW